MNKQIIPDNQYDLEKIDGRWFVYYKNGWQSGLYSKGEHVHYDAEDTKRELMKDIRIAIPCNCEDCVQ